MLRFAPQNLILLAIAITLAGCDDSSNSGGPPPPGAKPGHLTGKLSDAQGKPLSNVTVRILGFDNDGKVVKIDKTFPGPASEYDINVPDGKYDTPTARIGIEYNERSYDLPLAAADGTREWTAQHSSKQGMVRDFTWKISGRVPGNDGINASGYWGGSLEFGIGAFLGDSATIEITLTPTGPLIDGSTGKPMTFVRKLPLQRREERFLFDVPIGKYTGTAKIMLGNTPKPLRVACYTVDPTNPGEIKMPEKLPPKVPVEFECQEVKKNEWKLLTPNFLVFPPPER